MPVGNGSRTRKCVRPVVSNQAVYGCGPESFLLCNSGRYGEICLQAIPHAEWGIWGISPPVLILHVGRLLPETLTPGHFWSAALGTRAESLVLVDHVAWDVLGRHDGCRTCMESRGEEDPQRSCWVPVGPCGITCKVIALSGSNQFNSFEFTNEVMRLYCPWGSASLASPNTAALTPAPASAASISPLFHVSRYSVGISTRRRASQTQLLLNCLLPQIHFLFLSFWTQSKAPLFIYSVKLETLKSSESSLPCSLQIQSSSPGQFISQISFDSILPSPAPLPLWFFYIIFLCHLISCNVLSALSAFVFSFPPVYPTHNYQKTSL